MLLFLVHGLIVSTWVSRIAAIKRLLQLSDGVLGLVLAGAAFGSIFAIPIAGRLVSRSGARLVSIYSAALFCAAMALIPFASGPATLFCALFLFGAIGSINGVAMNSQAVAIESLLARPVMSGFHAMFSLGGIGGAVVGSLAAYAGTTPGVHFRIAAVLLATAVAAITLLQLETSSRDAANAKPANGSLYANKRLPWRQIPAQLLMLCLLGFCIFLSEGAIADWTTVYLSQNLNAPPATAAIGYGVFSAAMTVFRLLGDRVTVLLGRRRAVRTGGLTAAMGITWLIAAPGALLALPGIALAGAGYSVIIPLVFAEAGNLPGIQQAEGIATVSGLGYLAFLIGPPMIGAVSHALSLRAGIALLIPLALTAAMLPIKMRTD